MAAEPDATGRDQRHQQAAEKPVVLTVEFYQIIASLPQPYRTMAEAQCTGLRAENLPALEWWDIDFENLSLKVV